MFKKDLYNEFIKYDIYSFSKFMYLNVVKELEGKKTFILNEEILFKDLPEILKHKYSHKGYFNENNQYFKVLANLWELGNILGFYDELYSLCLPYLTENYIYDFGNTTGIILYSNAFNFILNEYFNINNIDLESKITEEEFEKLYNFCLENYNKIES